MKRNWIFALGITLAALAQGASAQTEPRFPQFPRDVHGLWYQPNDPGWAVTVFDHSTAMSAALLTYDFEGNPTWFYASTLECFREGFSGLNANCLGPMYRVTGPWFGESTFRNDQVRYEVVGDWEGWWSVPLFASVGPTLRRDFFLTYSIGNALIRPFADQPMKILPIDPDEPLVYYNTSQSGLWVTPTESGWGVGLFQQGMRLTATIMVHDRNRQPRWYVAHMKTTTFLLPYEADPGRLFEGEVYETRGHFYGRVSVEPHQMRRVGNASVKFSPELDGPAALSYSIDGVRVSKTIRRIAK
jgi:hypothetical protein